MWHEKTSYYYVVVLHKNVTINIILLVKSRLNLSQREKKKLFFDVQRKRPHYSRGFKELLAYYEIIV